MKKLLLLFISALLAVSVQAQSSDKPGNWKLIVSDEYPADDIGVATYDVVADFGADPTGVKDSWSIFQTALNKLGENRRGGVLLAPAGRYRITGKTSRRKQMVSGRNVCNTFRHDAAQHQHTIYQYPLDDPTVVRTFCR